MNSRTDFIKNELMKTGFALEDKVIAVFNDLKGFEIEPNYNFTDWQTGNVRELDMRVTFNVSPSPIHIEYVLLIECKKLLGNAWTFIRSSGEHVLFKNVSSIWDDFDGIGRKVPIAKILDPIIRTHIPCDTFASRYKEIITDKDKSNKREDNILSSAIKLSKAIYFEQKGAKRTGAFLTSAKKDIDRVRIYYPIIIFEGEMYEATMLPEVSVKSISSVHLNNFSIQNGEEIDMIIDVIKLENLKDFIKKELLPEAKRIKKNEAKFRDSYLNVVHKIKLKKKLARSIETARSFL
jgi:hypothetical protein